MLNNGKIETIYSNSLTIKSCIALENLYTINDGKQMQNRILLLYH